MATIQKRRGHYRVLVRRKGHPVQSATFTKINDARKWAQSIEAAITEGRHLKPPPVRCTLSDLIDRYIREVLPHKRASTRPNQTRHLRWWKQQLGYKEAADVTPSILAEHRDELAQRVSGATVNRYLAALSHAFTVAVKEWGWLDANPCRKLRRRPEPRGRVRYLSDTERERLLTACRVSRSPHLYVVVVLALSTGARKGELLGLTWRHVDLDKGRITLEDTKNGDRRVIPLTGHALDLLRQQMQGEVSDLVFPSREGTGPADLERGWRHAVRRAGLQDFRFHDLRHSCASYLAMGGASLAEIGAILGHRSLEVTRRYAHLSEGHTRKVLTRMNQGLFG